MNIFGKRNYNSNSNGLLATAVLWNSLGRIVRVICQLFFITILSRNLNPGEFSFVIFLLIPFEIIVTLGTRTFTQSLIQMNKWDSDALSTAFFLNLASSMILGIFIYLLVRYFYIGTYPSNFSLALSAICMMAPISALTIIPQAILSSTFRFKLIAYTEISASLVSIIAAIYSVHMGMGYLSLVVFAITQRTTELILLHVFCPKTPNMKFNINIAFSQIYFTLPLFGMYIATTIILSMDQIFIGFVLGAESLAFYGLAKRVTDQPMRLLMQSVERALLPAVVRTLSKPDDSKRLYAQSIEAVCLIAGTCFFGLAAIAEPLVPWIFGAKMSEAVPLIQLFAVQAAFLPIGSVLLTYIVAVGATAKQFKFTITRMATLVIVTIGLTYVTDGGARELAILTAGANVVLLFPNILLARAHSVVQLGNTMKAALRGFLPGGLAALAAFAVGSFVFPNDLELVASLGVGAVTWIIAVSLVYPKELSSIWASAQAKFNSNQ